MIAECAGRPVTSLLYSSFVFGRRLDLKGGPTGTPQTPLVMAIMIEVTFGGGVT